MRAFTWRKDKGEEDRRREKRSERRREEGEEEEVVGRVESSRILLTCATRREASFGSSRARARATCSRGGG
eukprot:766847-Hanusia_phi.AAC.5